MNGKGDKPVAVTIRVKLREILLDLAEREDQLAHAEAAVVPYWAPQPASVTGHHWAATCLRRQADQCLEAS